MTERELSDEVKRGNRRAYGLLYECYAQQLYRVILRYVTEREVAKDLLQECFLAIFDKISQYQYRGEGSLLAWLSRLCVNESLMHLRREKRMTTISLEDRDDLLLVTEPTVEEIETIPTAELERLISQLPDGYRTVLLLFLVEGKSHKEIAKLLGINEKSSSSQLARAKKQLATAVKAWHTKNAK